MNLPSIYKEVNVYNKSNKHLGFGIINKASESNHLILFTEAGTLFNEQEFISILSEMKINQIIEITTGDFIERIGEDEYYFNSDDRPYTKSDLITILISNYNS